MVSACDRELNAHFYSAASLKYHVPDFTNSTKLPRLFILEACLFLSLFNTVVVSLFEHKTLLARLARFQNFLSYGKCSKISNTKKERKTLINFLCSSVKQREVTNFAKGGNLIASLFKIGYIPTAYLVFSFSKLRFYCMNF